MIWWRAGLTPPSSLSSMNLCLSWPLCSPDSFSLLTPIRLQPPHGAFLLFRFPEIALVLPRSCRLPRTLSSFRNWVRCTSTAAAISSSNTIPRPRRACGADKSNKRLMKKILKCLNLCKVDNYYSRPELRPVISDYIQDQMIKLRVSYLDSKLVISMLPQLKCSPTPPSTSAAPSRQPWVPYGHVPSHLLRHLRLNEMYNCLLAYVPLYRSSPAVMWRVQNQT